MDHLVAALRQHYPTVNKFYNGLTYVCFVPTKDCQGTAKGLNRDLSANSSNIMFEVALVSK